MERGLANSRPLFLLTIPVSRGVLPAHLAGDGNGFGELYAGPDSELLEDLPQVVFHGVRTDEEL